jgi:hypothetical protein
MYLPTKSKIPRVLGRWLACPHRGWHGTSHLPFNIYFSRYVVSLSRTFPKYPVRLAPLSRSRGALGLSSLTKYCKHGANFICNSSETRLDTRAVAFHTGYYCGPRVRGYRARKTLKLCKHVAGKRASESGRKVTNRTLVQNFVVKPDPLMPSKLRYLLWYAQINLSSWEVP